MNKLIKNFKGSKPSKIILAAKKGDNWDTDIYVRPYPRNKLSGWMKELQDTEGVSDPISGMFNLMGKFCGLCLCDDTGTLLADDSAETVDFLLSFEDSTILLDLYEQSSRVSGLGSIAAGLLSAFDDEATESDKVKPNRETRRKKGK